MPYVPSFHGCIVLNEFKLIFIVTVGLAVIGNMSGAALLNFFTCSFFDASQVQGNDDGPKSFIWVMTFWYNTS
jgi:hypothetical protein